ncbi:ABC-type transport auxiliary lipoprotein family protein [Caenispirillum salinarum]|uniref:ABC-type transport auxiliary lipoprotein family protein n=1 Tax=Caenispirillum salinarum TaxID=859058 RepID=UPI00384C6BFE
MTPFSATRRRALGLGLAAVAAAGLAACSVGDPAPTDHFYRLNVNIPAGVSVPGPPAEGKALVQPFDAAGVLNQRALLWTENGVELQQYSYHFWAEPPAQLFQKATAGAVRAANVFEAVVEPSFRARPDWIVRGRIRNLEVIGPSGEESAVRGARVALTMMVTDPDDERVLLDRDYEESVTVPTGTVSAAAAAIGAATEGILARFLQDLAQVDLTKRNALRRSTDRRR